MTALKIIATMTAGGVVGGAIGAWLGDRESGDYNFALLFFIPAGVAIGAGIGTIIGAVVFT